MRLRAMGELRRFRHGALRTGDKARNRPLAGRFVAQQALHTAGMLQAARAAFRPHGPCTAGLWPAVPGGRYGYPVGRARLRCRRRRLRQPGFARLCKAPPQAAPNANPPGPGGFAASKPDRERPASTCEGQSAAINAHELKGSVHRSDAPELGTLRARNGQSSERRFGFDHQSSERPELRSLRAQKPQSSDPRN